MPRDNFEFKRVAHRGASGEAPENTLPALELAFQKYQVDMVEVDLQLTKDGIPVLFHDSTLERTTDGQGLVREWPLAKLKTLDAAFWFEPQGKSEFPYRGKKVQIPTLEEVLTGFPQASFCLEIKEKEVEMVEKVLELAHRLPRRESLFIGSFHGKIARRLRRLSSLAFEGILSRDEVIRAYLAFRLGLRKFSPPSRYAFLPRLERGVQLDEPRWIEFLHQNGVRVFYWTVNETSEMKRLLERGADGILTDYPGRLNQVVASKK